MNPNFDLAKAEQVMRATHAEVRNLRQRMGLSQAELAELMGVTEYTVWRWEHGGNRASGRKDEGKNRIGLPETKLLRKIYEERVGVSRKHGAA